MIEGKLVTLRELREEHLELLMTMRNELMHEGNFRQYKPLTMHDQRRYWEGYANSPTTVLFAVTAHVLLEDSTEITLSTVEDGLERFVPADVWDIVGEVRVGEINWRDRWGLLGLMIGKEHRQKGYGSEALYLMLEHAFRGVGLHVIRAEVLGGSISEGILHKWGASLIGTSSQSSLVDGKLKDTVLYDFNTWNWSVSRKHIYESAIKPKTEHAAKTI